MKKVSMTLLLTILIFSLAAGSVFADGSTLSKNSDTTMITYINNVVGTKYKFGGTSVKTGFDCSGFVGHIFRKMGYDLERRSADIATQGSKVAKDELIPGDLVFFDTSGSNNGGISHVGIYVGNGQFAHASTSKGVRYDDLDSKYYKPRYVTARRILSETDYVAFATEKDANVTVVEATTQNTEETTVVASLETSTEVQSN